MKAIIIGGAAGLAANALLFLWLELPSVDGLLSSVVMLTMITIAGWLVYRPQN